MRISIRSGPRAGILLACAVGVATLAGPARADDVGDGRRALERGQLDVALAAYQRAAAKGLAEGSAGVGRVWLRRDQRAKAMEAFREAASRDPQLAWAHYGQGEVLRRQGRCDEALPPLEKATDLDRKFPEAQLALGNCLIALGRVDAGIEKLNRGIKWGGAWGPRFMVARGQARLARNELREAGIDLTRARELAPRDPAVRRAIGEFYVQRGTWALAIPELEAALALDPNDVESQNALAQALYYDEQYDRALEAYRQAVELDPDFAPARLGLGNLLYLAGEADPRRYAEARRHLERYVALEPDSARGWSLLGRAGHHAGDRDSAFAAMQRAERLGDRSRELYTMLGRGYADRKEWEAALAALSRGETGPREWTLMAQIHEVQGRPEQADSIYRAVLERDSTSRTAAFAYGQQAKLRYRQKDFAGARALFDRAVAIDSTSGEVWFYRGLALKELNEPAPALRSLERAAELDSARADRWFWLGVQEDALASTDAAERSFRRAIELEPKGELAAKAYRQIGFYRLKGRQWKAAVAPLRSAVELDPRDALAWLWLAQAHQNAGDRAEAARYYRRVLELDPGNRHATQGLEAVENGRG